MIDNGLKIKRYLLENFLFGYKEDDINDGDSFLEMGFLDSTGIMELVVFLERDLGIKVKDEEILPENLDSIESIRSFIQKKHLE